MRSLLYRVLGTFRRGRVDQELDEEIGAHLTLLEERFRREGLSPEDARARARREFGSVPGLREAHRSARSLVWLEQASADLAYAVRSLSKYPGVALAAIVSMALAVGANSAIFSYADGLLLRPLPVPDPSGVVSLRPLSPGPGSLVLLGQDRMSWPEFRDFRDRMQSFEGLAAYNDTGVGFAPDAASEARWAAGYLVSGNFFEVLRIGTPLGRAFGEDEDRVPGRDAVVVLGHGMWTNAFGGDPSVVGRTVRINGLEFTVVGVAAESFAGIDPFIRPGFFVPAAMGPAIADAAGAGDFAEHLLTDRDLRIFRIRGRLKPGVSSRAAGQEAALVARSLADTYPETNRGRGAAVNTEVQIRLVSYPFLGLLIGALFSVVVVNLLVACANVANLMLTRGRTRAQEIAVRLALGASRTRIVRLLLAESFLIAAAAGVLALYVAHFAVGLFSTIEVNEAITLSFRMDARVVWFTLIVSIASALLFGLVPALATARADLVSAIKTGASNAARRRFWGRTSLAVFQIAGSMVLLVSATGFRVLFDDAVTRNPGFQTDRRITMRFDPALAGYGPEEIDRFYRSLADRALEVPGIRSAGLTSRLPLTWMEIGGQRVVPEGYELPPDTDGIDVDFDVVDARYFGTLGVPLIAGRGFSETDTADSTPVAIVNEAFASAYLGPNPLGKRIRLDRGNGPRVQVVGVTMTGKSLSVIEPPVPAMYVPFAQNPMPLRMTLVAETDGDPAAMGRPLIEKIRATDPNVLIYSVQTMEDVFENGSVEMLRIVGTTYDAASLMGLVLALVGLYAVLSYQVARRTREIGIRMALGAEGTGITKMFLKRAAAMAATGIAIGAGLSIAAGEGLETSLGEASLDPTPLVLIAAGLLATTLLASAIPARRAARVDPQQALRDE